MDAIALKSARFLLVATLLAGCKKANDTPECVVISKCNADRTQCWVEGHEGCIPSARECRETIHCRDLGYCTAVGKRCVVGKGDCQDTWICKRHGNCAAGQGRCEVTAVGCRQSEACRTAGDCARRRGFCRPAAQEHCQNSVRCREDGICTYRLFSAKEDFGECVRDK